MTINQPPKTGHSPTPVSHRKASLLRIWLPRLLAAILLLFLACLAGAAGFFAWREISLSWPGQQIQTGPAITTGDGAPQVDAQGTPLPLLPGETPAANPPLVNLTPWAGAERVTVLLLGLDYRDWSAGEKYSRSDSMILLTLDPQTKTAGILSIPRDLWVSIPGFKHGKINTAYYLGDAYQLPGGGPALAIKTVEQLLGVPINYYAQIDFGAFVRFIDEIGGVKIDVPQEITVDLLGTGSQTKKKLKPGIQLLPGEWALAYARARYTENGDFDRARRQQQVIMGIRNQVLSFNMLPILVSKAPTLYKELASGIRTNMSLDDVIKLAALAQTVPDASIQRSQIDKGDVFFGKSPDGLDILIPIPDDIHTLRDQIFASAGSIGPQVPGAAQEQAKAENAKVALYNGSGASGLGNRAADFLRGQGVNVTQVADAAQVYPATTIIDHTGNPYVLKLLVELFKIAPGKIQIQFDPNNPVDVEIFLGREVPGANSIP